MARRWGGAPNSGNALVQRGFGALQCSKASACSNKGTSSWSSCVRSINEDSKGSSWVRAFLLCKTQLSSQQSARCWQGAILLGKTSRPRRKRGSTRKAMWDFFLWQGQSSPRTDLSVPSPIRIGVYFMITFYDYHRKFIVICNARSR